METITVSDQGRPLPPQSNTFRQRPRNDLQPDPCASSPAGGCIRMPIKIKDVKPIFPVGAAAGNGTQVVLEGRIGTDGFIAGMEVVSAADQMPRTLEVAIREVLGSAICTHQFGSGTRVMLVSFFNSSTARL